MGGYCNRTIRLYRPTATPKPGEELQLDHDTVQECEVSAWIKQLSSGRALNSLGIAATSAYNIRFTAPEQMEHAPAPGWQIKDDEEHQYMVRAVLQTGSMVTITAERL